MGLAETPISGRAMGAPVGFQPVWALDENIGQLCLRLPSIHPPVVLGEDSCQNSSLCLSPSYPQSILRYLAKHLVENQTQHVPWLSRLITLFKRKCGWPSSGLTWSLWTCAGHLWPMSDFLSRRLPLTWSLLSPPWGGEPMKSLWKVDFLKCNGG